MRLGRPLIGESSFNPRNSLDSKLTKKIHMAAKPAVKLLNGYLITAAGANAYEVGTDLTRVSIVAATVHNYGTTPETFTIQIVDSGDSAADKFKQVLSRSIAPDETKDLFEIIGKALDVGDFIYAQASTDTKLSMALTGTTFDS